MSAYSLAFAHLCPAVPAIVPISLPPFPLSSGLMALLMGTFSTACGFQAESFLMSAFYNGALATMKANYEIG